MQQVPWRRRAGFKKARDFNVIALEQAAGA
jgi:hypothetical protein